MEYEIDDKVFYNNRDTPFIIKNFCRCGCGGVKLYTLDGLYYEMVHPSKIRLVEPVKSEKVDLGEFM